MHTATAPVRFQSMQLYINACCILPCDLNVTAATPRLERLQPRDHLDFASAFHCLQRLLLSGKKALRAPGSFELDWNTAALWLFEGDM